MFQNKAVAAFRKKSEMTTSADMWLRTRMEENI